MLFSCSQYDNDGYPDLLYSVGCDSYTGYYPHLFHNDDAGRNFTRRYINQQNAEQSPDTRAKMSGNIAWGDIE